MTLRRTYVIVYIRIVAVVQKSSFIHLLSLFGPIQLDQNISSVNIGLGVIRPHAYSLSVEHIRLF